MSRINATAEQTQQGARVPLHRSLFKMQQNLYLTTRFGEYSPFWSFDSFESDRIRQRSITTTRSLSLGAPLMEDITNKRDYFQVYYDAILPINWEKLFITPKKGDDVDWSQVGCFVHEPFSLVFDVCSALWSSFYDYINSGEFDQATAFTRFFQFVTFVELFFSAGSLLNHFGCHLSECCKVRCYDSSSETFSVVSIDKFIDSVCSMFLVDLSNGNGPLRCMFTDGSYYFDVTDASSLRYALSNFREYGLGFQVSQSEGFSDIIDYLQEVTFSFTGYVENLNLAPLWAYQIVCSHFYSNDNVDYIFSANLFRELVGSYCRDLVDSHFGEISALSFEYNGVRYQYDWLSARYFNLMLTEIAETSEFARYSDSYFRLLLNFRRSLRFMDYFSGARTQPLAVGDTSVAVNDNKVSVIDVTRQIQAQRLLNNVMRLPQQIEGFIKGLTGTDQSFDYHNPGWLAHTTDTVFAAEVENTGEAQQTDPNSVTATLRGKSSSKEFQFESDRPCILLGIQYFDIRRAYYTGIRRTLQYGSRYDMFTPELQYIGDQPIKLSELFANVGVDDTFGYTEQYNWFKMTYDEAMGGFVTDSLPGWTFLLKPFLFRGSNLREFHISPNFIRSIPQELDSFFLSLTGFSLGTYFHFQQKVVNLTDASRPMVKHSQILG